MLSSMSPRARCPPFFLQLNDVSNSDFLSLPLTLGPGHICLGTSAWPTLSLCSPIQLPMQMGHYFLARFICLLFYINSAVVQVRGKARHELLQKPPGRKDGQVTPRWHLGDISIAPRWHPESEFQMTERAQNIKHVLSMPIVHLEF